MTSLKSDCGPQVLKRKSKWTRFLRSECGPGGLCKKETMPNLGKRDIQHMDSALATGLVEE